MEPMKPLVPFALFKDIATLPGTTSAERWWPKAPGEPATAGAQDGLRYAVFPDSRRLVIERDGQSRSYDTGGHRISGVAQSSFTVVFTSQDGQIALDARAPAD